MPIFDYKKPTDPIPEQVPDEDTHRQDNNFVPLDDRESEQVLVGDTIRKENNPRIQAMLDEVKADNRCLAQGSKAVLFVHLKRSRRLWQLRNEENVSGDRFVRLAKQITGYGKNKAYKLESLYQYHDPVVRGVEAEYEAAMYRCVPYEYPSWTKCLKKYHRRKDDEDLEADEPQAVDPAEEGLAGPVPKPTEANQQVLKDLLAEIAQESGIDLEEFENAHPPEDPPTKPGQLSEDPNMNALFDAMQADLYAERTARDHAVFQLKEVAEYNRKLAALNRELADENRRLADENGSLLGRLAKYERLEAKPDASPAPSPPMADQADTDAR